MAIVSLHYNMLKMLCLHALEDIKCMVILRSSFNRLYHLFVVGLAVPWTQISEILLDDKQLQILAVQKLAP